MLVDQKLREGIAVPFFGHDAMTTPAPAALALKTGARIWLAANRRLAGARFHVTVQPVPNFMPSGDEARIRQADRRHHRRHREIIRDDPANGCGFTTAGPRRATQNLCEARHDCPRQVLDKLFFGRDPLKDFPKIALPATCKAGIPTTLLGRAIGKRARHRGRGRRVEGASVVTMASEIQRLQLDAVVIAIDTWLGSSEHYLWEKFIPDLDFEFGYPRLYHKFAANICRKA